MPDQSSPTPKTWIQEFAAALTEHIYRAKLISYSLMLVVGVTQIIIREHFPKLKPPWPLIAIALIVVLFGVLFVPPFLVTIQVWKKRESPRGETHS